MDREAGRVAAHGVAQWDRTEGLDLIEMKDGHSTQTKKNVPI